MNELTNSDHWLELQTKLKQRYPELTDADLHLHYNSRNEMLQMIGYKLRKTRDEMMHIITLL